MQTFSKSNRLNVKHGPPLIRAARNGDVVELEGLLRAGVVGNPNTPDALGKCALVYACEGGHQACAELLLRAGADPNHRGEVRIRRPPEPLCTTHHHSVPCRAVERQSSTSPRTVPKTPPKSI